MLDMGVRFVWSLRLQQDELVNGRATARSASRGGASRGGGAGLSRGQSEDGGEEDGVLHCE